MTKKKILTLVLAFGFFVAPFGCGGDSATGPTSVSTPQPPPPPVATPEVVSSAVQINRSSGRYHYIGWQFTIKSPKAYEYAYVEIRWYDANGFQVEWSNWSGRLKQGTHTYSDDTMVLKTVWAQVVRREVVLSTTYYSRTGQQMGRRQN